jgi:photosystem II stability/assembly factor-like uncharacterized protein
MAMEREASVVKKVTRWLAALGTAMVLCGQLASVSKAGDGIWTQTSLCRWNCDYVREILVSASDASTVYANLDYENLYRSADSGTHWESIGIPKGSEKVIDLEISDQDSQYLYAVVRMPSYKAVYATTDGGDSWVPTTLRTTAGIGDLTAIAVDPNDEETVYVGGDATLHKTTDGGLTWTLLTTQLGFNTRLIVIDPSDSDVVYVFNGGDELYRSSNGGQAFSVVCTMQSLTLKAIGCEVDGDAVLYAVGEGWGLFRSTDWGTSWTPTDLGEAGVDVIVDPTQPQNVYVRRGAGDAGCGANGVYASTDAGQTWRQLVEGMGPAFIRSLALSTQGPDTLFAGTAHGGIWKYTFGPASQEDFGISINHGATHTDSTDVTIALTARPGTSQMMVSNDGGFTEADWEPFVSEKDWTLEVYGGVAVPSTVYAKFKTVGKVSPVYQDHIVAATGGPVGGATSPAGRSVLSNSWRLVSGAFVAGLVVAWIWARTITRPHRTRVQTGSQRKP